MTDDVEERLDQLEERIESVSETQKAVRETSVKPRLQQLKADSDDAREERAELQAEIQDLRATVAQLQTKLEAVAGLADDEASNPEKRAADLRQALIRHARDRDGTATMYWREVKDTLQTLGHSDLKRPQIYTAIEDAATTDGFEKTKTTSDHGNRVTAIRVDIDELTAESACNEINTRNGLEAPKTTPTEVAKEPLD